MAANNNWLADTVGDFIHSHIWAAPIHTFIEANCATFDYDDDDVADEDNAPSSESSLEEQMDIHKQYQRLVDSLIYSLGEDLSLDQNELKQACQLPTNDDDSTIIDESFEQLYAARDFQLFQEMMRRKNLILQLQALVSLQLQWGLLKQNETGDDLILSLLLQATSSPTRRDSTHAPIEPIERKQLQQIDDDDDDDDVVVVQQKVPPPPSSSSSHKKKDIQPKTPTKKEYHLPDLRLNKSEMDAEWYRNLRQENETNDSDSSKKTSTPQTIGAIPEEVLREKLRELTIRTTSSVDDGTAAAIKSRKNFLQQQRDLIIKRQRDDRTVDLEKQARTARPQSAAHVARSAIAATNETKPESQQPQISNDELTKRRAMAAKLKREVVDKR